MKKYVSDTQQLITGTYNAMRDRLIQTQHENLTLKAILKQVLNTKELEKTIREMESKNEIQQYQNCN